MCSKVVFMMQRKRTRLALAEKSDIWRRWKAGQSLHEIGRAYGRPSLRRMVALAHLRLRSLGRHSYRLQSR
jgi:hypothetical protein